MILCRVKLDASLLNLCNLRWRENFETASVRRWYYICPYFKMACTVSQWEFKHLEVVGTRVSSPVEFGEISARIPRLKIETRTPVVEKKNAQQVDEKVPRSPTKRQNQLYVKPQKEKIVTFKVVLPKEKSEVLERNYLCICEDRQSKMSTFCSVEDGNDVKEIEFSELMELFNKFNERSSMESFSKLTNTTRGFHGNKILSDNETIEVCLC